MNHYRKFAGIILCIELLLVLFCNGMYMTQEKRESGRIYRVEAARLAQELQDKSVEEINLSDYPDIVRVSEFCADDICNNEYVVEKAQGKLYRIEYRRPENRSPLIYMNFAMALMVGITVAVLLYIGREIVKPFHVMRDLPFELAKGNLSMPVLEKKSRYFGRFLWGMDMLRDNLEEKREKELNLHREKKTLILSLSHDIKTPLSAISLYAKALSDKLYDTEEKQAEAIEGICKNAAEIEKYVAEIAAASREDFLHLEVKPGECYLSQILNSVTDHYRDKLSVTHTELQASEMEECLIRGDCDRIIEVFQNIMENAVKYGDGGEIRIFGEDEEDCKLVYVENTGCTLREEELPHLFDSFYRGSNSQGIKGSGLGLYICKKLMNSMDGEVFAQTDGEKFRVAVVLRKA